MVVCNVSTTDVPDGSPDFLGIGLVMEENTGNFSVITETAGEINTTVIGIVSAEKAMEEFLNLCESEGLDV